jgi:hypothetical protein
MPSHKIRENWVTISTIRHGTSNTGKFCRGGGLFYRRAALQQGLYLIHLKRMKKKFPPRNTSTLPGPRNKGEKKKGETWGISSRRIN